jgi:alkylhydroperoxidase family enzyme
MSDAHDAAKRPPFSHTRKVSRLPPLPEKVDPIMEKRFAEQRARGADPINLHLAQGHAPQLSAAKGEFTWKLRNDTKLGRKLLELVIVRVASTMDCAYELFHHLPMIAQAGYSEAQVNAVRGDWRKDRALFTPKEQALLQFVDELLDKGNVIDATWEEAARHFSSQEIVEVCYGATSYYANAMFVKAVRLEVDPPGRHTAMGKF